MASRGVGSAGMASVVIRVIGLSFLSIVRPMSGVGPFKKSTRGRANGMVGQERYGARAGPRGVDQYTSRT
ncbi:hypothetical protein GCM10010217_15910 [Streptomyces tubercidicus]